MTKNQKQFKIYKSMHREERKRRLPEVDERSQPKDYYRRLNNHDNTDEAKDQMRGL